MKTYNYNTAILIIAIIAILSGCKKFLEIPPPKDSLIETEIFSNDNVATSALAGIYNKMATSGYASGGSGSISVLCGLSSDELIGYSAALKEFSGNQLTPTNTNIANTLWSNPYQTIYSTNAILEGLSKSVAVTPNTKSQIQGEALFIRAFVYFYLVNIYGAVPLNLSTDYRVNQIAPRSSTEDIYLQVIKDLLLAEKLLNDNYTTTERIRPNLSSVQALLSRTYLYLKEWSNAEMYATKVIQKNNQYDLVPLYAIFLKNSKEAIWQLMPTANTNALEGNTFILTATPTIASLNDDFVNNAFEVGDKRKLVWIKSFANTTGTYYYPFKYKVKTATTPTEYSMVMRLAELYLIRAEARTELNNLSGSIEDIDKIRARAELPLVKNTMPGISKGDLKNLIQRERRVELFSEWGHRWFDLKRTGQSTIILSPKKANWQATDVNYPLPQTDLDRNPNLIQNEGY